MYTDREVNVEVSDVSGGARTAIEATGGSVKVLTYAVRIVLIYAARICVLTHVRKCVYIYVYR